MGKERLETGQRRMVKAPEIFFRKGMSSDWLHLVCQHFFEFWVKQNVGFSRGVFVGQKWFVVFTVEHFWYFFTLES